PGDRALVHVTSVQRIGGADGVTSRGDPTPQPVRYDSFAGARCDQVAGWDAPALTDTIDPSDALLEAHRIPGELEVDDEPAGVVEVESFACCVGGEQHGPRLARELHQR